MAGRMQPRSGAPCAAADGPSGTGPRPRPRAATRRQSTCEQRRPAMAVVRPVRQEQLQFTRTPNAAELACMCRRNCMVCACSCCCHHQLYSPVSAGEHERRLSAGCALVDDGVEELGGGIQAATQARIHLLRVQRFPAVRPDRAEDRSDDRGVTTSGSAVEHTVAVAEAGVVRELRSSRQPLAKR